jgi:effector-binding domain-containing protein
MTNTNSKHVMMEVNKATRSYYKFILEGVSLTWHRLLFYKNELIKQFSIITIKKKNYRLNGAKSKS